MVTFVLNDETAKTPIGEVLSCATDPLIEITDETGNVIGRIMLETDPDDAVYRALIEAAEADIEELRRRSRSSRENDVTTQQLLKRLSELTPQ